MQTVDSTEMNQAGLMSKLEPPNIDPPEVPLALEDTEFIPDPAARPLRILGEYFHPQKVLREQEITDTVVFFGSARTPAPENRARTAHQGLAAMTPYYQAACDLAQGIAEWSLAQKKQGKRFVHICTGGGPGIMEAANRGASQAGARSVGFNIVLPHEQHPNPYIAPELNFNFQYFFMRKYWFLYFARALLTFPGGFGTMDELFETLTLRQTGIVEDDLLIVLYGKEHWNRLVDFQYMADSGMISEEDLDLFHVVDSVKEAMDLIVPKLQASMET